MITKADARTRRLRSKTCLVKRALIWRQSSLTSRVTTLLVFAMISLWPRPSKRSAGEAPKTPLANPYDLKAFEHDWGLRQMILHLFW